jgi:hypothetical protein
MSPEVVVGEFCGSRDRIMTGEFRTIRQRSGECSMQRTAICRQHVFIYRFTQEFVAKGI